MKLELASKTFVKTLPLVTVGFSLSFPAFAQLVGDSERIPNRDITAIKPSEKFILSQAAGSYPGNSVAPISSVTSSQDPVPLRDDQALRSSTSPLQPANLTTIPLFKSGLILRPVSNSVSSQTSLSQTSSSSQSSSSQSALSQSASAARSLSTRISPVPPTPISSPVRGSSQSASVSQTSSASVSASGPRKAMPLSTVVIVQPVMTVPILTGQKPQSKMRRPRVALALGGGGVRGAAHVGVLRVLMQAGIPVDIIAGTSMGAIVGGLYSAGIDIGVIEKKFDDGSLMRSFMDIPLSMSIATAPVRAVPRTLTRRNYDGLYTGAKFRKYLDQTVPAYDQYVENFKIPFAAIALDLVDGKPYALTRGKLGAVIQASSAVPELREPVQIGNQLFVDGGVVDNIPVTVARDMGGDIVIAVNVDESFDPAPLSAFKPIGSVARRMVALQLATNDAVQLRLADIVIRPHVDGIGLITTRPRDARQAIRAGEKAAWDAIPFIRAKLAQANTALAGTPGVVDALGK